MPLESVPPPPRPLPRSRISTLLMFIGATLFLIEEALWRLCTRFFQWLGRLGVLRWLDARLVRLAPAAALGLLCVPVALLLPVKIAGLWMIASGRFFGGCAVMLAAKIASTAIVARLFLTMRSQLLTMPWFARLYNLTCAVRDRVHAWTAQQAAWQDARRFFGGMQRHLRAWSRRRRTDRPQSGRPGVLRRWRRSRRRQAMGAGSARSTSAEGVAGKQR